MPVRLDDIAKQISEDFPDAITEVDHVRDHIVVTHRFACGGEIITRREIDDNLHKEKLRKHFA